MALLHPLEAHAAETDPGAPVRVVRKDDLIRRQRDPCAAGEDDERPGWTVLDDGQLGKDLRFAVEPCPRHELDEKWIISRLDLHRSASERYAGTVVSCVFNDTATTEK